MAVLRKFLHLEDYLHPVHFQNLGKLLLTMSLLWGYFVFAERLTTWYGNEPVGDRRASGRRSSGSFAPLFWTMVVCNFVIPVIDPVAQEAADDHRLRDRLVRRRASACGSSASSSSCRRSATSTCRTRGAPTARGRSEIMITISTFAAMGLLYTLFAKFVPIISIWEMKAGEHPSPALMPLAQHEHALGETHA